MKLLNIFSKNKNIKSAISNGIAKKFLTFGILIVILAVFFVPTHTVHAGVLSWFVPSIGSLIDVAIKAIAYVMMTLSGLILTLSGLIFDKVIDFTIVKMAANIGDPAGVGGAITIAWATLRDIANMCFIFVLLYAAFKTMFDTDFNNFSKTVKDIIIVALLINFSLFFSKVVIDASNIVAVGFYNSIATQTTNTITGSTSISSGYMNMLGLQTFHDPAILDSKGLGPTELMTIGVMSSVFMLITAVILLMAGVMFAARFIILVFLMILSPLALIAYVIPGQRGKFEEWKSALIAQSFFAPVYFALTWVVFKLGKALITTVQNPAGGWAKLTTDPQGVLPLIFNYVLIIGFSIAALVISKSMASKTKGFGAISGGIGTVAIGGAAWAGRNTAGRASGLISETQREKWSKSNLGRAGLWMADKGKKGSFDVRASSTLGKVPVLGGELGIMGKAGGKGGFAAAVKTTADAKTKYAKEVYGQTAGEKEKTIGFDEKLKADQRRVVEARKTSATNAETEKGAAETDLKKKKETAEEVKYRRRLGTADSNEEEKANKEVKDAEKKLDETTKKHGEAVIKIKSEIEDSEYTAEVQRLKKINEAGKERQKAYAKRLDEGRVKQTTVGGGLGMVAGGVLAGPVGAIVGGAVGGFTARKLGTLQGRKAGARAVREEAKGKSKEKKLADAYKDIIDAETKTTPVAPSDEAPVPAPAEPSTPPPTTPTT